MAQRGDDMTITEEMARDWTSAIGAVTVGEMALEPAESHISGRVSWAEKRKGQSNERHLHE